MDDINNGTIHMWWKRIITERFDKTSDHLLDRQISMNDYEAFLRGRWNRRIDYLFSCIGYGVSIINIWQFTLKVQRFGGGTFVILYFFFSCTIGLPLLFLEMGLGQFTSMSNTKVYECVPILFGIAWSQINLTISIMIYYGVILSWSYQYLISSFRSALPWSSCNNIYNTPKCLSNYESSLGINNTFRSSYQEYFYRYVLGIQKPNGEMYTIIEPLGSIEFHRLLPLTFVWLVSFVSIMCGIKISSKVVYVTALLPYLPLCFLFILGCSLPGGAEGLIFLIKPNLTAFIQPITYIQAFEQVILSFTVGGGIYIALSSHNSFHDNFLRDGVCFMLVDWITSILGGSTGLTLIGYLAYRHNRTIDSYLSRNSFGSFFLVYPEALTTISGSNFFTILFMIAIVLVGVDSHFIMLESVVTSFIDVFNKPDYIVLFRLICASTICIICYLCGLLFITPNGVFYFGVFRQSILYITVPVIVMIQCLTIGIIYGHERLRKDFQMMLGFALPKYVFIAISYICPLCYSVCTVYQVIQLTQNPRKLNKLAQTIFILNLLFVFSPIVIGLIYIIIIHLFRYKLSTLEEYVQSLIKPPIFYGPRYKINWLLDIEYKEKFIKYRKDPEFLKQVSQFENIRNLYRAIKAARRPKSDKTLTAKKRRMHKSQKSQEMSYNLFRLQNSS